MKVPSSDHYLDSDFTEWINSLLARDNVPGVSVAVIKDGHVESAGFGLARLPNTPATADTVYPMASTTKSFTTALIGLLMSDIPVDQGEETRGGPQNTDKKQAFAEKGWKTPVSWILPDDFKTTSEYITRTATIEDIASHRSGIAGHDMVWGPLLGRSLQNTTRCLRHLELIDDKFRAGWQYNNLMYGVLGNILETISGKEFWSVLEERILTPLDMRETWLGIERLVKAEADGQLQKARLSRGYYWHAKEPSDQEKDGSSGNKAGYYVPEPYTSLIGVEPAGGLISTVNDFAKWVQALLDAAKPRDSLSENSKGRAKRTSIISNDLWQELTTPRIQIVPLPYPSSITPSKPNDHATPQSYSLGWVVDSYMYPGELVISHGGGLPGFATGVVLVPNRNFGVVVAGNGGMSNAVGEAVAKELVGRRLGISREQRRRRVEPKEKQSATEDGSPEGPDHIPAPDSTPWAFNGDSDQLEGNYFNPAYNTMSIIKTTASAGLGVDGPHLNGIKIVRKDLRTYGASGAPFLITPLGKRGVRYRILLHRSEKQPYADRIIYALETLDSRGDLIDDPAPSFEKGYGRADDPKYPGGTEPVWQSIGIRARAAVVDVVKGAKADKLLVAALGLRVMRVDGDMDENRKDKDGHDGTLKIGWQNEMIWFHKVHD